MIYLGLGDRDQALTWLEKGCNDRDVWALNLKVADLRGFANGRSLCRSAEEGRTGTMNAQPTAAMGFVGHYIQIKST
jgi:hypothetical protein